MMSDQFVMCAREVRAGKFNSEPGRSRYLLVPEGELPTPTQEIDPELWFKKLRKAGVWGKDARDPRLDRGDILVFVHGYNNDQEIVMKRHARLRHDLVEAGFKGEVMSFDWPSSDQAVNYLEDRHDAKQTAMQLVTDGIRALSLQQTPDCTINVHLIGHSTGAYVIREAFDDADDARLQNNSWTTSQVIFIAGDVSAESMSESNATTQSLYRHCVRLTNYSNLNDAVLKLSNAKRIGTAPRVGRIGMPKDAPQKGVNVDCSAYFAALNSDKQIKKRDQAEVLGTFDHSWHIGNKVFARDLFETLRGDFDRAMIPTREVAPDGTLSLAVTRGKG